MTPGPREDIIAQLRKGDRTRGAIVDATPWAKNTVGEHLRLLLAEGVVEKVHEPTGLYSLVEDPENG